MRQQLIRLLSSSKPQTRLLSTFLDLPSNDTSSSLFFDGNKAQFKEWKRILTKAEKIVGYPTSFLNLRYLVSDEVAHFASLFRKLMLTNHPLITTARRLITDPDKYTQINGLIVLLVSKASGLDESSRFLTSEITDGIHQTQRCLAEITEMINMASIVHNGILDVKSVEVKLQKDMDYGNKLAVLCGDFLLANACKHLAKLENAEVVDLMSQVIADISQGIFFQSSIEAPKVTYVDSWFDNLYRGSSSLLANSCRASQLLVNHSSVKQQNAFNFALNLDITHRIWLDLNDYLKDTNTIRSNSLINAIYKDKYSTESLENNNLRDKIIQESVDLLHKHYLLSSDYLKLIQQSNNQTEYDAFLSLNSILNIMKNSFNK